ncbi:hypothetical protein L9F63_008204, partial [Diploptera punctata]
YVYSYKNPNFTNTLLQAFLNHFQSLSHLEWYIHASGGPWEILIIFIFCTPRKVLKTTEQCHGVPIA